MDFDALRRETQKLIEQSQKIVQLIENRDAATNAANRSFASVVANQPVSREQSRQPSPIQNVLSQDTTLTHTPIQHNEDDNSSMEEKYIYRHKDVGPLVIFNKQAKWCPNLIQRGYPKACSDKKCLTTKWHISMDKLCLCISPIDGIKEGGVMEQDSTKRRCDGSCHPNTSGRKNTYITLTACRLGIDCKREGCKHQHWDENIIRWKFPFHHESF